MKSSKIAKLLILGVLLVVIDQVIKVLVVKNMYLGETIDVIGDWCKLHFTLNEGMAFGWLSNGVVVKTLLSIFRIVLLVFLCKWIVKLTKDNTTPVGVLIGLTLITAGALGNLIDCLFYGMAWPEMSEIVVKNAPFSFMYGKVVDMFYFPLFDYKIFGFKGTFFSPIFNFADVCVTCGALYLLFFHYKYFSREDFKF